MVLESLVGSDGMRMFLKVPRILRLEWSLIWLAGTMRKLSDKSETFASFHRDGQRTTTLRYKVIAMV